MDYPEGEESIAEFDAADDVKALHDLGEDDIGAIEELGVVAEEDVELAVAGIAVPVGGGQGDGAFLVGEAGGLVSDADAGAAEAESGAVHGLGAAGGVADLHEVGAGLVEDAKEALAVVEAAPGEGGDVGGGPGGLAGVKLDDDGSATSHVGDEVNFAGGWPVLGGVLLVGAGQLRALQDQPRLGWALGEGCRSQNEPGASSREKEWAHECDLGIRRPGCA